MRITKKILLDASLYMRLQTLGTQIKNLCNQEEIPKKKKLSK